MGRSAYSHLRRFALSPTDGLRAALVLFGTVTFAAIGCAGGSEPGVEEQGAAQHPEEADARAMLADAAAAASLTVDY
jgi:hypothetical protein